MTYINITKFVLIHWLEKDHSLIETRRLKNVAIFIQIILSFVVSRKIRKKCMSFLIDFGIIYICPRQDSCDDTIWLMIPFFSSHRESFHPFKMTLYKFSCGFGDIYWRNPWWEHFIFCAMGIRFWILR